MTVICTWRGPFDDAEVNALHAAAFEHAAASDDWQRLVEHHSLGWATARRDGTLAGFVNVVWDGLCHAWIQDLMVAGEHQRRGVGTALVALAREAARQADCDWLHVDFDDDVRSFYVDACGFAPTAAGLVPLR